uniref:HicA toxin of toxin-antitoxin n=1 Tax=Candidatus Kentrum sp. LPFa TaxID=2126335 RepID=A0A450X3J3_9GAMM|nr:MAG: hypothetical protein BECKLPF1236B_GA0070989_13841 [Candidatus Kentron sp. LPFa]
MRHSLILLPPPVYQFYFFNLPVNYPDTGGKIGKLYRQLLLRRSDANVSFDGLRALIERLGFSERIRGDHHIFTMDGLRRVGNNQRHESKEDHERERHALP